ncbi:hypothetical protein AMATHDRAFT_101896, partial [Amanita thiersii Skay4041]
VRFMHQHNIAHLELKPDNPVVNVPRSHLYVIDFGISCFASSRESVVSGYRGTRTWVAPEVGTRDGFPQTFSPIAADLWATGNII